ncbi:MAG: class I SAM-dependent methyltransferase [Betaproteobacteria bacterium]|nr:class I SAM-dependent methyltransferase [Betaproteobacteria bacterium]
MSLQTSVQSDRNPWLDIPATEYQAHMQSPDVAQSGVLAELFGIALRAAQPASILLLGCGTGNGLQLVDDQVTKSVTCIDINPAYLSELATRLPAPGHDRSLIEMDLNTGALPPGPFDLVHAPFVFEFLDWRPLVPKVAAVLAPGGLFTVVIQRESRTVAARTPTPYFTLRRLDALFNYVDPLDLGAVAIDSGLTLAAQRDVMLPRQKSFTLLTFNRV